MSPSRVDVAIAGGGPAGAAAAIALARAGQRVLVADGGAEATFRVGEGLPPSARLLLGELGVLPQVLADGHRPSSGTLAFWGSDVPHANDFLFQPHGHGLQLDRARFDASLRRAARAAGAEVIGAAQLRLHTSGSAYAPHHLHLHTADGAVRLLEATWLIDATGRAATLARALGATRIRHNRLFAFHLRCRGDTDADRDGRTWVEAVEDGWWYSVLLPSGERLFVYLGDPDPASRRVLLHGDGLWRKLHLATGLHSLCMENGYRPHGRACGAAAGSAELDRGAGERWLAAGDAALAFDPLSSKGIASALYTGLQAARAVLAAASGDHGAAGRYADHIRHIHRVYRVQLRNFYAMETRWPASSFWSHRLAAVAA